MIDYTKGYHRSFEYRMVSRDTWGDREKLDTVLSCNVTRDVTSRTVESATISIDQSTFREDVVRAWMIVEQGVERERKPIGTWLCKRIRETTQGMRRTASMTCHSMLMPLEALCPIGYVVPVGAICTEVAAQICRAHGIAPVVETPSPTVLATPWVASMDSTWLDVVNALLSAAGMRVSVDPFGRIRFLPSTGTATAPRQSFRPGDGSILLPSAERDTDWTNVPNACEVQWSDGTHTVYSKVTNDDPSSPVSTTVRGYEVVTRLINPTELQAGATDALAQELCRQKLLEASVVDGEVQLSHGWCELGVGDTIRLDYPALGDAIDATVTKQDFALDTAMQVRTTAVVRQRLWEG